VNFVYVVGDEHVVCEHLVIETHFYAKIKASPTENRRERKKYEPETRTKRGPFNQMSNPQIIAGEGSPLD
jgi:hypothetical protein